MTKSGHVFQGRYQAILCDREAYLLELVRYLHLNPARIRTPLSPWTYRWSSHRAYLGHATPVKVSTSTVLASFHRQLGPARQAYRRFMLNGLPQGHQARFYETGAHPALGDERFLDEVDRRTGALRTSARIPRRVGFGKLLTAVATCYAVSPRTLLAPGRQRAMVPARAMLVSLARNWSRLTTVELGRRLQRDPSMISRLATTYAAQPDRKVETQVRQVLGLPPLQ